MPEITVDYNSPAALKTFLESRGLGMRKKYGQNFLINPAVRVRLADALGAAEREAVWEIGPGLGAMTVLLLERGLDVRAFEIDQGFIAALKELFGGNGRFTLVEGDVIKTWKTQPAAPYLLGNLPYNIAAALLGDLVEGGRIFSRAVVTVQKETADRMTARPGSKDYSSFTVLCASAYTVKPLARLGPSSFYPPPRVESRAVVLEKRGAPAYPKPFYALVRGLFAGRRKTVKNNLKAFLERRGAAGAAETAGAVLEACRIRPGERPENLGLEEFSSLAHYIKENVDDTA